MKINEINENELMKTYASLAQNFQVVSRRYTIYGLRTDGLINGRNLCTNIALCIYE